MYAQDLVSLGITLPLSHIRRSYLTWRIVFRKINSMTCNAIISLQARIPAQLDRSWTQEPVMLEDALGRVTRFHLEFIDCWEVGRANLRYLAYQGWPFKAFESILEVRFRQLPGHRKIKQKEYALRSNINNKDIDYSTSFNRCFLPGQHYDMSMIFNAARAQNSCPACLLDTGEASDARVKWWGIHLWFSLRILTASSNGCGLWYQRIVEIMPDVSPVVEKTAASSKRSSLKRQREADSESDDEPRQFRRVHIRCRQRAKKGGSQDGAGFETLSKSGTRTIRCICGERVDLGLLENGSDHAPSPKTAGTWLIQCVNCKAWQHRSCVGTVVRIIIASFETAREYY